MQFLFYISIALILSVITSLACFYLEKAILSTIKTKTLATTDGEELSEDTLNPQPLLTRKVYKPTTKIIAVIILVIIIYLYFQLGAFFSRPLGTGSAATAIPPVKLDTTNRADKIGAIPPLINFTQFQVNRISTIPDLKKEYPGKAGIANKTHSVWVKCSQDLRSVVTATPADSMFRKIGLTPTRISADSVELIVTDDFKDGKPFSVVATNNECLIKKYPLHAILIWIKNIDTLRGAVKIQPIVFYKNL